MEATAYVAHNGTQYTQTGRGKQEGIRIESCPSEQTHSNEDAQFEKGRPGCHTSHSGLYDLHGRYDYSVISTEICAFWLSQIRRSLLI